MQGTERHGHAWSAWPTLGLILVCYGVWSVATAWVPAISLVVSICLTAVATTLHASLSHEALHGNPFRNRHLNAALVFPNLPLVVPYMRFRATHLAHHQNSVLTDPYDDPESHFLDPEVFGRLPAWWQAVLRWNNTLLGRMLIGPVIGQVSFMQTDLAAIRAGDRQVLLAWLWHVPAAALPLAWVIWTGAMPLWAFFLAVYLGHAILKIRTFLEHRAHELSRGRTVIVEDRGPLALLFLNNNLHALHHTHPKVPWYALPALYRARKFSVLARNEGYRYASYWEVLRRHLFRGKDPVAHPLWRRG